MSNRIDLTQFEELPDAPWGYGYWEYENTRLYEEEWDYDKIPDRIQRQRWWIVCPTDGQGHLRSSTDGTGFVNPDMVMIPCDEPTFSEGIDRRPAIVDAVNALPEILAELKRCYEKLDNLRRLATWNHTDSDNIAGDDDLLLVLTELLTSE